jgi:hypothetical protein
MTDKSSITPPTHDPDQGVRGNEAGTKGGHFGNEYDSHEHRTPRRVGVGTAGSGQPEGGAGIDPLTATHAPGEAIPPNDGARGWVDQKTGAVHGSGAGAGGGQPGEDFDADASGGSDGAERSHRPTD